MDDSREEPSRDSAAWMIRSTVSFPSSADDDLPFEVVGLG